MAAALGAWCLAEFILSGTQCFAWFALAAPSAAATPGTGCLAAIVGLGTGCLAGVARAAQRLARGALLLSSGLAHHASPESFGLRSKRPQRLAHGAWLSLCCFGAQCLAWFAWAARLAAATLGTWCLAVIVGCGTRCRAWVTGTNIWAVATLGSVCLDRVWVAWLSVPCVVCLGCALRGGVAWHMVPRCNHRAVVPCLHKLGHAVPRLGRLCCALGGGDAWHVVPRWIRDA